MTNGAPNLLNAVTNIINNASLMVSDALLIAQKFQPSPWGIYNASGVLAIKPDSIVALNYDREWSLLTFPVEQGGFESYNKVQLPYQTEVTITKGGSLSEREQIIWKLEEMAASLAMFTVYTPEEIFMNVNVESFNYSRTSTNGAGMITANIRFKEIRQTATATSPPTKNPNDAGVYTGGTLQTTPLPPQTSLSTPVPL
jgi:hypothetical protein